MVPLVAHTGASDSTRPGLENGFEKNLVFLNLKSPKFGFFLFFAEILYKSYLISYFTHDL